MKLLAQFFLVTSVVMAAAVVDAAQTNCPEHFAGGQAPNFINLKLSTKTREVCYSELGLMHSGVTKTALYSAEHLTREKLVRARTMKRSSKFFADPNIPASERAELRDYARSGFDRGHIAPSGDMPDQKSQQECFSLANMVPQVPQNNRGPWEAIEATVRKMAKERGELFVVTGPIFKGSSLQRIGGVVMVPTQLYKAVYDPRRHEAGAYLIDNAENATAQKITLAELEKLAGIDMLPSLNAQIKETRMVLPDPKNYKERKPKRGL
jgi:endonuclease G, mitochondrial